MKPLFVPLKTEYFNAFESGEKTTEYRLYGPRWNERTCRVGRDVVLSCGYGKQRRLRGKVIEFKKSVAVTFSDAWLSCYGENRGPAACITIKVIKDTLDESKGITT